MSSNFGGFQFEFVCRIVPEKGFDGNPTEYMPQSRYRNEQNLSLHKYGRGPFCRFSLPMIWQGKMGVYIIIVDGEVKYAGECEDLANRFNMGYGNISPRNCFEGGQQTNCRINHKILELSKKNSLIEVFFHETLNRLEVESTLISRYSPEWNRTGGKSTGTGKREMGAIVNISRPTPITATSCRDEVLSAARQIVAVKGLNDFTVQEIINHLRDEGSQYRASTIRTHVISRCCSNAPDHHAVVYHDFERIGRGVYRVINLADRQT